jgi:adenine-specific DNA-methyltransferase
VLKVIDGTATLAGADGKEIVPVAELVAVAEFGEPIYPGLKRLGSIDRGGAKPAHVVIKGENYHALQALQFTHAGKVDCIYIDPPYNTGARDWKYNNDYVDGDDAYRHSKWLAMMQRRLLLSRKLLRSDDSVLIVTIDEKEVNRLALLLDQTFPGCSRQTVSIVINPKGTGRANEFSRTDEYALFVRLGSASIGGWSTDTKGKEVRWRYLRRTDDASARGTTKGGPRQFYPIYVDRESGRIRELGEPLEPDESLEAAPNVVGAVPVFPIREDDGMHMNWGLTAPSLQEALENGFVRVTPGNASQPYTIAYLTGPNRRKIASGEYEVTGVRPDGSKVVVMPDGKQRRPTTAWNEKAHEAGVYGTSMLGALIPARSFPFPKSLYAVEDCLRLVVGDKPEAVVLDFFAGSGTTAHAVARLNSQDAGRRQSISVTNNEVSESEAKRLAKDQIRPGDPEWEGLGIFEHITRPRIEAAITGRTPEGAAVKGDYKFTDEFPMADGFEENVEFVELEYLDSESVQLDRAFERVASLLWMRAGSLGSVLTETHGPAGRGKPYVMGDHYGVLFNPDRWRSFVETLADTVTHVFVVTDSASEFANVAAELPEGVEVVRLYENYLSTFAINTGATAP